MRLLPHVSRIDMLRGEELIQCQSCHRDRRNADCHGPCSSSFDGVAAAGIGNTDVMVSCNLHPNQSTAPSSAYCDLRACHHVRLSTPRFCCCQHLPGKAPPLRCASNRTPHYCDNNTGCDGYDENTSTIKRPRRGFPARRGHCRSVLNTMLLFVFVMCVGTPSSAAPASQGSTNDNSGQRSQVSGDQYLMEFGYLPQSDMETGALRTEEERRKAIRNFQAFAQIPITGRVDAKTMEMMNKPRCGLPDRVNMDNNPNLRAPHRGRRYVTGPSMWEKRDLTYRILNYTPGLSLSEVRDAIQRAFAVWNEVTHLNFYEQMQGYADIYIRFARGYHYDGYPFDGKGLVLAHAFFPGEDRGGDVHFDDDEDWTYKRHDGTNLYMVAAHEIGHALGLSHSSVPGALMFPWYQGYQPDFHLHSDDIAGIQSLYGYKQPPQPTAPPTPHPPPSTPGTPRAGVATDTSTTQAPDGPLNPCEAKFDAISIIRGSVFAFSGKMFWRLDMEGKVMDGYPVETSRFWYGFPEDVDSIDAVYERLGDQKIIFFKGSKYWQFSANQIVAGFPKEGRPIEDLGFPHDIKKVDAAFIWGYNQKTYFFTGNMYWRYNELNGFMEYDYPRDMSMWKGLPLPIDSALQYTDGLTYFFKDDMYWKFNDNRMEVAKGYPKPLGPDWLQCSGVYEGQKDETTSAGISMLPTLFVVTVLSMLAVDCMFAE